MNGRDLTLGLVGALALGAAVGRRGSRATDPISNPAFRRWFGKSKVVNMEGRPLVVYHGSPQEDIEVFEAPSRRRAPAFFFSDDPDLAGEYGTNLYSVYLSMVRPLVVDAKGADWLEIPQRYVSMRGWAANDKASARTFMAAEDKHGFTSTDGIAELALQYGFDGAIIKNVNDSSQGDTYGLTTVYVVFNPTQIKSATDNQGSFDPKDPRINFNRKTR